MAIKWKRWNKFQYSRGTNLGQTYIYGSKWGFRQLAYTVCIGGIGSFIGGFVISLAYALNISAGWDAVAVWLLGWIACMALSAWAGYYIFCEPRPDLDEWVARGRDPRHYIGDPDAPTYEETVALIDEDLRRRTTPEEYKWLTGKTWTPPGTTDGR